jgi:hypothetical protein
MKGYKPMRKSRVNSWQLKSMKKVLKQVKGICKKHHWKKAVSPTFAKMLKMDNWTAESYLACEAQISRGMGANLGANFMLSSMMLHSLDLEGAWATSAPVLSERYDKIKFVNFNASKHDLLKPETCPHVVFEGRDELHRVFELSGEMCALDKLIGESREQGISRIQAEFEAMSMEQYFYSETDRVVIYPESADLLTSIFEADYHLDGFELDAFLKDFILMMPEGFEIDGTTFPSMQISISSELERDLTLFNYVMEALKTRCRDEITAAIYEVLVRDMTNQYATFLEYQNDSSDNNAEAFQKWADGFDELGADTFYKCQTEISLRSGSMYMSLTKEMFLDAVNSDRDPEARKRFFESCLNSPRFNFSGIDEANKDFVDETLNSLISMCKMICSVLVYCQALGDEVLHKGVPFRKDNVVKLSKSPNKIKGTTSMTLRGPKGFSSKKAQSHYRKWHFRTLKDERFYQSDEWKDKPRGSRVVFVRDSVVNRDVSPHVLTDGTNVEDKVMTAEMQR